MAVSGTTTYSYTRDQIIKFSMRKLGLLPAGATPDSTLVTTFSESLNLILKRLITKGAKIWTIQELTLPLTSGKTTYVIGPTGSTPDIIDLTADKPMRLFQAWLRNVSVTPQNDIPLQILSQHDYNEFGSKFSSATPNSVFLQVGREQSILKMYLTPDAIASTLYQIHFLTQRLIYDVTSSTQTLDVPIEQYYMLGWLLARDGILDYGIDQQRTAIIISESDKYQAEAEDFDIENNSTFLTPDLRWKPR